MTLTPQEAIRRIREHNYRHSLKERLHAVYITEALNMAIEALEKEVPKEPYMKDMEGLNAQSLVCPTCGEGVTNYWAPGNKPKRCQFCGQALDRRNL